MAATAAHAATDAGVPALRITAPNGESSVLIGSAHVPIKGLLQPDASVFEGARRYVIEHLGVPQSGDQGSGKELGPWARSLTREELATYLQRALCAGVAPEEAFANLLRPSSQKANQLAYTPCGWMAVLNRDSVLSNEKPAGIPLGFLEDDAVVEATRQSVPSQLTDLSFRWALAHDPAEVLTGIGNALNQGDYEALRGMVDASIGNPQNAQAFDRIMVDGRNAAWMPRLRRFLDEGHAVIVVGAMHLPGENGLIQKLSNDGYRVERIALPSRAE
nr:TraB/GumN family protein [Burkholderia sp. Ac-20365]